MKRGFFATNKNLKAQSLKNVHFSKVQLIVFVLVFASVGGYLLLSSKAAGPTTHVCTGRSFYVDYAGGADTNNGTSNSTPWKRAPGMVGFSGTYAHQAHDCFYLKGGVTWPASVMPWVIQGSGNATDKDYYGPDYNWYTGATWSQPILDAGNANISANKNEMVDAQSVDYITIDNLKFDHFAALNYGGGYGTCEIINALGAQNDLFDNITGSNQNVDYASDNANPCSSILGATYAPYQGNSVVQNSTFYGASSTRSSAGGGLLCFGNVKNVTMHDLTGMIFPCGHGEIGNNTLYNCGYPNFPTGANSMHADAIQSDAADGSLYIHDNLIHDTGSDSNGNECESMLIGNGSETDYVWNNVLYNIHGNAVALIQNATPGLGAYIWNNTIVGGQDGAGYCVRAGHGGNWPIVKVQNNHCITSASSTVDPAVTATTLTIDHNLLQTAAQATSAGYTSSQSYAYSPTLGSSPTVGAGSNLTSSCSGSNAGLCSDTLYGTSARTQNARPGSGAWDVGAYEYAPPAGQTANLWIDTNGGTCTRNSSPAAYNDAAACASMQAAMTAAQASDTVIIKNGTYGAQSISSGTKSSAVSFYAETYDHAVTAADAYSATTGVYVSSLALSGVDKVHIFGVQATPTPDNSRTDARLAYAGGGDLDICASGCSSTTTSDIIIDGFHGRSFFGKVTGVVVDHSSFGGWDACYDTAGNHLAINNSGTEDGFRFWAGTGGSTTPTNSILRNSVIHDIIMGVNNSEESSVCGYGSSGGPHADCMQNNGGTGITIESNIFFNCPSSDIQWNPFSGATIGTQLIQNNYFGPIGGIGNGTVLGAQGSGYDCSGITVRNNFYNNSSGINPGSSPSGCTAGNIQIYGNVFKSGSCISSGTNYHDNIFETGSCGTNPRTCTPTFASIQESSPNWLRTNTPDFHLSSSDTCAIDHGYTSYPATDFEGDTRPQGAAADAGPDEVVGVATGSWYVDPNATGSNNGMSWANAWTSFASINWASVQPGDTVYLSGGSSSQTYTTTLTASKAGTSGSPVTIAAGQDTGHNGTVIFDFSADGNSSTHTAINVTANYVTIDGNYNGNNHIECLNIVNTTTGTNGICVNGNSHNGLTVNHIWAQNVNNGVKNTSVSGTIVQNSSFNQIRGDAAIALAGSTGGFDSSTVSTNYIETVCQQSGVCNNGSGNGGPDGIQNGSGVTIKYNTFKEIVMNITTSGQHPDMIQNQGDYTKVYSNDFQNVGDSNFDFDMFSDSTPHDIWIYNNLFHIITAIDPYPDFIRVYSSGASATSITNFKIMNNLFADDNNGADIPAVSICFATYGGCAAGATGSGSQVTNNIFINNGVGASNSPMLYVNSTAGSGWSADHNVYYRSSAGYVYWKGTTYTAANFVSTVDTSGKTNQPSFTSYTALGANNDFSLSSSDTVAKDTGASLASYFTVDKSGTSRPQGSAWDIGPYEYNGTTSIPGDINSDGHVTIVDLSILLSHYGTSGNSSQGDCNNDSNINITDLSILLSHYGT